MVIWAVKVWGFGKEVFWRKIGGNIGDSSQAVVTLFLDVGGNFHITYPESKCMYVLSEAPMEQQAEDTQVSACDMCP